LTIGVKQLLKAESASFVICERTSLCFMPITYKVIDDSSSPHSERFF
jgi:hypothetical protein